MHGSDAAPPAIPFEIINSGSGGVLVHIGNAHWMAIGRLPAGTTLLVACVVIGVNGIALQILISRR